MVALSHLFTYFNSRPHGGRLCCRKSTCFRLPFQLTPSRRATSARVSTDAVEVAFQLTPSRRATMNHFQLTQIGLFQLTPSRRATLGIVSPLVAYLFQLTPSRRATDCRITSVNSHLTFQLTPSRRATGQVSFHCRYGEISTHALTEGDGDCFATLTYAVHFNSRPHGGRPVVGAMYWKLLEISTHALTEGDGLRVLHRMSPVRFQLTPSRRATVLG